MGMQGGLLNDPRWLAAGAGGILSALAVLWASRDLPLGIAASWLVPFPIFAAGLAMGPATGVGALMLASVLVPLLSGSFRLLIYFWAFAVPAAAMVALAFRAGRIDAGRPLALLGLWPAALVIALAVATAGEPGGLDGVLRKQAEAMRQTMESALMRGGASALDVSTDTIARLIAVMTAFMLVALLAANGAAAQRFLARRGWALAPTPVWTEARMPRWYAAVPLIAAGGWFIAPSGADMVPMSVLLATLLPVFLAGVAAVHRLSRGRPARPVLLTGFYLGLILLSLPAMAAVTGFGIYDQWGRRNAPPGGNT